MKDSGKYSLVKLNVLGFLHSYNVKFMFSKKPRKFDEIFKDDLTLCTKCQIDGEDFVNFCGLPRKHELYHLIQHRKCKYILLLSSFKDPSKLCP